MFCAGTVNLLLAHDQLVIDEKQGPLLYTLYGLSFVGFDGNQ